MRDVDQQPRIDFTHIPMGQLVNWLDRLAAWQALGLVWGSTVIVLGVDLLAVLYDLRLATLYIVPISLACWIFRARTAVLFTIALTVIASGRHLPFEMPGYLILANFFIRTIAFGLLAAVVLGFRRTYDFTRIVATRDRMTGALNKAAFQQRVQVLLDTAGNADRTVLLLCLDLDGFKAINDQHGHHAGDQVLEMFSVGAARSMRRGDCFGRLGGDEFAVAIPVDAGQEARRVVEELHARFSSVLQETGYAVTCSMGALEIPCIDDVRLEDLMRHADRLMYAAKNGGKNCLRFETVASSRLVESRSTVGMSLNDWEELGVGGA